MASELEQTTLIFKPTAVKLETIEFDACINETHSQGVDISSHPVEQGAEITDHASVQPDQLQLNGVISNSPLSKLTTFDRLITLPIETIDYLNSIKTPGDLISPFFDFEKGPDYVGLAFTKLLALKDARTPITVVTSLKTYTNMMIVSLSEPRDAKTGDALNFSATLKQIRIVSTKRVTIKLAAKKKGAQPTDDAKPEAKETSILRDGYDGAKQIVTKIKTLLGSP